MKQLTAETLARLEDERNIWMATMRPDGRPHLVPVWFVWHDEKITICIQPNSVKAKNLVQNANIALSLEDGSNVVICEGSAETVTPPYHPTILAEFKRKYDWDITTDADYRLVLTIIPTKWLVWGN